MSTAQMNLVKHNAAAVVNGVDKCVAWLRDNRQRAKKAEETAVKVEGFRLKNLLQKELRKGAPGGRPFKPLTSIARRLERTIQVAGGRTRRQTPNRNPLARLGHGVRYNIRTGPAFKMLVGFVQPTHGPHTVSKSWRRIAKIHQEGFDRTVTPALRRLVVRRGTELGTVEGGNTPFFLRRRTNRFQSPARPIIDPFWTAHANQAAKNINKNFRLKMAGKRI